MMNIFKKTSLFASVALFGVIISMLAPVFSTGAYAADKINLNPDVKNVTAGTDYGDTEVSNVNLGDTVRFKIRVNNESGATLEKVMVRANLNKVTGTTKHWTMDAEAEIREGSNATSVRKPVSVFMKGDWNLEYVAGSTKRSTNGENPVAISDIAGTSPLLRTNGYELTNYPAMTQDPQTLFYFDAKVIEGTPNTPVINVQLNKEVMNVTKGTAWSKDVKADAGDTIRVRIWFHNGGTANASDKPATDVVIKDKMPFNPQHDFVNTVTLTAKEVAALTSSAKFSVSSVQGASYVPGSTKLVIPTSTSNDINVIYNTGRREAINDVNGLSALMSEGGYRYGTLNYCWEYQRFVEYELKVASVTPTPTPTTPGEVKAATLPKTGAAEVMVVSLVGSTMAGLYLRKFRIGA